MLVASTCPRPITRLSHLAWSADVLRHLHFGTAFAGVRAQAIRFSIVPDSIPPLIANSVGCISGAMGGRETCAGRWRQRRLEDASSRERRRMRGNK